MRLLIKLVLSVVVISVFILLVSLGFWQLNRAQEKSALLARYAANRQAAPLAEIDTTLGEPQLLYRRVQLSGAFNVGQQFLLDNKFHQHRLGFYVITPFKLAENGQILLVNRGWVPAGKTRDQLPKITVSKRVQKIQGMIIFPSKKAFVLNDKQDNPGQWPRVIQKIVPAHISTELGQQVYPFTVLLNEKHPDAYVQSWQPVVMPPAKHKGYALQWFALAATWLVAVVVLFRRRR